MKPLGLSSVAAALAVMAAPARAESPRVEAWPRARTEIASAAAVRAAANLMPSVETTHCVSRDPHRRAATASDCPLGVLSRNVVPAPATIMLLGTGLLFTLGAAGFRREDDV